MIVEVKWVETETERTRRTVRRIVATRVMEAMVDFSISAAFAVALILIINMG